MKFKWRQAVCRACFLLFGLCGVQTLSSHTHDCSGWGAVKCTASLTQRFQLTGIAGFRVRNHFREAERTRLNVGGRYKVLPSLYLDAAYEVHYANSKTRGWEIRHRYYAGLVVPVDIALLRISFIERFQQTFIHGEAENHLRSQVRLAYAQKKWVCSPFFAMELFQPLGDEAFFSVARMRYRSGVRIQTSKHTSLDIYYCRQYDPGKRLDIAGITLGIRI